MTSRSSEKIASILERNSSYSKTMHVQPPLLNAVIEKNRSLGRRGLYHAPTLASALNSFSVSNLPVLFSLSHISLNPVHARTLISVPEAAIVRNAGGRARPALPSLLALDSLGNTGTILVIHHTDCGMSHYSESEFRNISKAKHPEIDLPAGETFGAIVDPETTVKDDVKYLNSYESWRNVEIAGLVLDTFSGVVKRVI
ncbi:hypothetical protein DSL72_005170 [Monilinia vaccinii-corymbosi]|uniref:Carbonic anhydrase n=1 Tax=Monilinia vaccinii-corymbosi TaxID=61207 RepID=A0A8A3PEG0_9HELO|nr:hypothetical protein DSL72_005170 [Monilinia vaccinii-corymbosi]